ncbi:MAG: glycyl-radical enzyme activating protein [Desulfobacteraceae bacterium]|jgi:pyruvate formate lyase activating enzyme|nr:MAG: glycyl-radical enzyme activating protein [Desulfobacteraceae bacterium]
MTDKHPLILDIKGNSLDDGPGIRSVVFFKGCPLSCVWCHNPESKKTGSEIAFDPAECVGCDTCLTVCPEKVLSRRNPFFIDRDRCTLCFACVDECPSGALSRVGREMTVDEIVAAVVRDKPFFDTSGGGVTLSGGEPTLFPDFLARLLAALKAEGIHTLLETCGQFNEAGFMEQALPLVDIIYYDIKLIDPDLHKKYCGVANRTILENFIRLTKSAGKGKFMLLPRTPLIPGITATPENLSAIAKFLADHDIKNAQLLPYNPLWPAKNQKIGIAEPKKTTDDSGNWIPREQIMAYQSIFADHGIAT